jgi:ABC-type multidrug transport system fused ATPase/permease subunit
MAGFVLIYVSISVFWLNSLRSHGRTISGVQSHRIRAVQEGLGGIRDVLLDAAQPVFLGKFSSLDGELRLAQARNHFIGAAPRFVIEAAGMILIVLLAAVLSAREGGLAAALPVLGVLALGAQRLLPLAQFVYLAWARLASSRDIMSDVLEVLETPIPKEYGAVGEPMPFERAIEFKNVTLRYSGRDRPAVDRLAFAIPRGCRLGLVGRSGSGKSTTIDLLMGLLEPNAGHILVDGRPLDDRTRRMWQRQVAHVPQEIFLSDASFLENIAFSVAPEEIDHARAREAAARAELAEFIEGLPEGYAASVGERGVRLSGGQRKRIGIARALYKQASVLIFDEATNGLDHETEQAVLAAIAGLPRDLTVVMVTHKVSTLGFCDRIVRLEAGRVRAVGTYDEVLGRDSVLSVTS